MDHRTRTVLNLLLGIVLLGANLVLLNLLLGRAHTPRLDLTEGKRFTLTDATVALMADLEEPGEILFYYSSPETQHDKLRPLIDPLRDLLSEFEAESDGHIDVRFVVLDKAGKQAQDEAENLFGVRPYPIPVRGTFEAGYRSTYFSVVVSSGSDFQHFTLNELIRIVDRGGTDWEIELTDVEYLVAQALRKVARGFNSVPGALVARDKRAEVTVYLSGAESLPEDLKGLRDTVVKVGERLSRESGGRLDLTVVDPFEGRSKEEHRQIEAELEQKYGIQPIPMSLLSDDSFYSWAIVRVDDRMDVFPLYSASGGSLGEADIKNALEGSLKRLIPGFLPVVGIAAPQPPFNPMMMQMGRQPPDEFGALRDLLGGEYEVVSVDLAMASPRVPRNVSTLVVVRPGELSDEALYEIDQFVMRGGRLVVCADKFHLDVAMTGQTGSISLAEVNTDKIQPFLAHFGVSFEPSMLRDTRSEYLPLRRSRYIGGQAVRYIEEVSYPFFLRIEKEAMSQDHPITSGLPYAGFFWAAPVSLGTLGDGVTGEVLVSSSPEASPTTSSVNVQSILETGYQPPENAHVYPVAVALRGSFKSYFADKPIPGLDKPAEGAGGTNGDGADPEEEKAEPEAAPSEGSRGAPLKETQRETSIVVFGDSDWLSHMVFGTFYMKDELLAANLELLKNAFDWGNDDTGLLEIRNRPPVRRPLTELAGLSPEEKERSAVMAFAWTCFISVVAVIGLAVAWIIIRKTRKPFDLAPAPAPMGAES